jgi:hypothetical protein
MLLVGMFSLVCCVLAVGPRFTAKVLSYGRLHGVRRARASSNSRGAVVVL